jgi:hypothetical protein
MRKILPSFAIFKQSNMVFFAMFFMFDARFLAFPTSLLIGIA